jgi:hypothetical protein
MRTRRLRRSRWPRGLRRRSAAAWLLGSRVQIQLWAWMFVSCVYMLCCPVWVEASATCWPLVQWSPIVCQIVWLRNLNTEKDKTSTGCSATGKKEKKKKHRLRYNAFSRQRNREANLCVPDRLDLTGGVSVSPSERAFTRSSLQLLSNMFLPHFLSLSLPSLPSFFH